MERCINHMTAELRQDHQKHVDGVAMTSTAASGTVMCCITGPNGEAHQQSDSCSVAV